MLNRSAFVRPRLTTFPGTVPHPRTPMGGPHSHGYAALAWTTVRMRPPEAFCRCGSDGRFDPSQLAADWLAGAIPEFDRAFHGPSHTLAERSVGAHVWSEKPDMVGLCVHGPARLLTYLREFREESDTTK